MDKYLRELREVLLWPLVVLLGGWVLYAMTGNQANESSIRVFGELQFDFPMTLPRQLGLIWYIIPALWVYQSERRSYDPNDEDLYLAFTAWVVCIVLAGLFSWGAMYAGAWLTAVYVLLVGYGVAWLMNSFSKDEICSLLLPIVFIAGSTVGIWTGFWTGLAHGFLACAGFLATVLVRSVRFQKVDLLGLSR